MKAHNLELAILTAVARGRNDEWLPCSLGDLRNRLREVDPDAGNTSMNSIAEAAISLNQKCHLLLGKREDGVRRLPFDLQKQFDEGYISNFFCRGSFELKITHQGRRHLEESEQSGAGTGPREETVSAQKGGEVQERDHASSEESNSSKEKIPQTADAVSTLEHRLRELSERASSYFDEAIGSPEALAIRSKFEVRGNELANGLRDLGFEIIDAASHSPLVPKADVDDLRITIRKMVSALRFREYTHYSSYVVHEEDRVYGIQPESSQEIEVSPEQAQTLFSDGMTRLREVVNDFIDPRTSGRPYVEEWDGDIYRESSHIQLTSHVFPPSDEKDCSIRDDLGEMLSQT
jgi:hypothetical protein